MVIISSFISDYWAILMLSPYLGASDLVTCLVGGFISSILEGSDAMYGQRCLTDRKYFNKYLMTLGNLGLNDCVVVARISAKNLLE